VSPVRPQARVVRRAIVRRRSPACRAECMEENHETELSGKGLRPGGYPAAASGSMQGARTGTGPGRRTYGRLIVTELRASTPHTTITRAGTAPAPSYHYRKGSPQRGETGSSGSLIARVNRTARSDDRKEAFLVPLRAVAARPDVLPFLIRHTGRKGVLKSAGAFSAPGP
jgi:hypothetical protein